MCVSTAVVQRVAAAAEVELEVERIVETLAGPTAPWPGEESNRW
jgi:hypothetical protein